LFGGETAKPANISPAICCPDASCNKIKQQFSRCYCSDPDPAINDMELAAQRAVLIQTACVARLTQSQESVTIPGSSSHSIAQNPYSWLVGSLHRRVPHHHRHQNQRVIQQNGPTIKTVAACLGLMVAGIGSAFVWRACRQTVSSFRKMAAPRT
jgi:hypothetical protein